MADYKYIYNSSITKRLIIIVFWITLTCVIAVGFVGIAKSKPDNPIAYIIFSSLLIAEFANLIWYALQGPQYNRISIQDGKVTIVENARTTEINVMNINVIRLNTNGFKSVCLLERMNEESLSLPPVLFSNETRKMITSLVDENPNIEVLYNNKESAVDALPDRLSFG